MKHTPGPWHYKTIYSANKYHLPLIHIGADNWAQVYGGEGEANARLIAAAPDLLAALEKLAPKDGPQMIKSDCGGFECFFCGGDFSNTIGDFKHHTDCDYLSARAAILKARGES